MIATAPTKSFPTFSVKRDTASPDLAYFRRRYPETVASLGALPQREEWLKKIWELETRRRKDWETQAGRAASMEAFVRGAPPEGRVAEATFDVIYAGGALALLHAAALSCGHDRSALALVADSSADTGDNWTLSEDELDELVSACALAQEDVEALIVNRRRGGFVKFHDAASRIKAEPLWLSGTHDVVINGASLLARSAERLRQKKSSAVIEGFRFVRAYVEPSRVTVEAEGPGGVRRFFGARLFVDVGGADSAVARQLSNENAYAYVCPSVGTVARGFVRGEGLRTVDFSAGELLVSTEDASNERQLFWQGSPGAPARDEYATRLFFFDAPESAADKSLLALFEHYFESLDSYKRRSAGWRIERPLFDYAVVPQTRGWRKRRRVADERVMHLTGESTPGSGVSGLRLRDLQRVARLTNLALESDATDARALAQISEGGSRVAEAVGFVEFMRPAPHSAPQSVNETMNALASALAGLDERVRRELFQGHISLGSLRRLLSRTAQIYPRIFARVRERFGARGTFLWLAGMAEAVWSERREGTARLPQARE